MRPYHVPHRTSLIVGPGFKTLLPGHPTNPDSHILESDPAHRQLIELDFGSGSTLQSPHHRPLPRARLLRRRLLLPSRLSLSQRRPYQRPRPRHIQPGVIRSPSGRRHPPPRRDPAQQVRLHRILIHSSPITVVPAPYLTRFFQTGAGPPADPSTNQLEPTRWKRRFTTT